jgi:hypothetical protein
VFPSPLSELSKVSGHKRVAVSDISDLVPNPSKKLNTPNTTKDRMLLAAHSLSALKNSPATPTTPFFLRVSGPADLAPFTLAQSSVAESSPTTQVDSVGLQSSTAPLSRKMYKAGKNLEVLLNCFCWKQNHLQWLIPLLPLRRMAWPCPLLKYDNIILEL